jgi:hypothetical protein
MDKARVRVDAVEKVGCMLRPGNNRIRVNGVLIPYRAFDPLFESMLLARPPSKLFFNSIGQTEAGKGCFGYDD